MKNLYHIVLAVMLATLVLQGCEQEVVEVPPRPDKPVTPPASTSGTADFTTFVAIGNSLSAGFQGNALFTKGQNESLPRIIFTQMGGLTSGSFNQPDINSVNGYNPDLSNPPSLILGRLFLLDQDGDLNTSDDVTIAAANQPGAPVPYNSADLPTPYTGNKATLNNFAAPGLLLVQAGNPDVGNPASPMYNALYGRFASNPGTSTPVGDLIARDGSFFLFWLGNADIIFYAASGASNPALKIDIGDFTMALEGNLGAILGSDPAIKGVMGNIPDVTAVPFFTTISHDAISPLGSQAALVNAAFDPYNQGIQQALAGGAIDQAEADLRTIQFNDSVNSRVLMMDESLTDLTGLNPGLTNMRQATEDDLILLPAQAVLGTLANPADPSSVIGVAVPIGDELTLIPDEINEISGIITAYNAAINAAPGNLGATDRVALADVNAALNTIASAGVYIQPGTGVVITPSFSPPTGAFSPDGVHPTSRGYAYVANSFIDAINEKFGSDIPQVNLGTYNGALLPVF